MGQLFASEYYLTHLMTQYALDIKKLDYETFMSPDTKQKDIINEIFTLSDIN